MLYGAGSSTNSDIQAIFILEALHELEYMYALLETISASPRYSGVLL